MEEQIRVMVIDDDEKSIEPFTMLLELVGNYRAVSFAEASAAMKYLRDHDNEMPDIIVADIAMPGIDGYQFGEFVKNDHRLRHVPLIYLSALSEVPDKIRARSITPHFFPKDGDRHELVSLIRSILNEHIIQSGLNPLTGLPGNTIIERTVNKVVRSQDDYSVFHIDCDNFKPYNDAFGTYAGDRVIRETARATDRALIAVAGDRCFLGHLGGDDFIAVTWGRVDPEEVCRRVFEAVGEVRAAVYGETELKNGYFEAKNRRGEAERFPLLTVSIGVVCSDIKKVSGWAEASNFLCEVKRKAKSKEGNSYHIDVRRSR